MSEVTLQVSSLRVRFQGLANPVQPDLYQSSQTPFPMVPSGFRRSPFHLFPHEIFIEASMKFWPVAIRNANCHRLATCDRDHDLGVAK